VVEERPDGRERNVNGNVGRIGVLGTPSTVVQGAMVVCEEKSMDLVRGKRLERSDH
jgi:hypothetical protein